MKKEHSNHIPSENSDKVSESKKAFNELQQADLDNILDNLIDRDNDHGIMVAHDAAVPDSASAC